MSAPDAPDALAALAAQGNGSLADRMGIEITEASAERVVGTMPVEGNTQPYGLLHGGASVLLAETIGSTAGTLCCADNELCVGIEINANHLAGVRSGEVTGTARPLHVGGHGHVAAEGEHALRVGQRGLGAGQGVGVDVQQRDGMAPRQEPARDGQPDAPGTAGDQRHACRSRRHEAS